MTTSPAVQDQIKKAIGSHGMWKRRLLEAINHRSSEFAPANVRVDDQCDFGKWLHQGCDVAAKASPHYGKVKQLHAEFHLTAANVLELAVTGRNEEAQNLLKGEYSRLSLELVTALQVWQRG